MNRFTRGEQERLLKTTPMVFLKKLANYYQYDVEVEKYGREELINRILTYEYGEQPSHVIQ